MKRVVVTGIGLISSIGNNLESTWNNLISGISGIKKITNFDTEQLSCKIAGFISHEQSDKFYLDRNEYLSNREINRNDRFIQYGLIASEMAINDSNLKNISEEIKNRIGVSVGSGIGGLETIYNGSITLNSRGPRKISPFFIPSSLIRSAFNSFTLSFHFFNSASLEFALLCKITPTGITSHS